MLITPEQFVWLFLVVLVLNGSLRVIAGSARLETHKYKHFGTADVFVGMIVIIVALVVLLG
jgi:hypothetical protein